MRVTIASPSLDLPVEATNGRSRNKWLCPKLLSLSRCWDEYTRSSESLCCTISTAFCSTDIRHSQQAHPKIPPLMRPRHQRISISSNNPMITISCSTPPVFSKLFSSTQALPNNVRAFINPLFQSRHLHHDRFQQRATSTNLTTRTTKSNVPISSFVSAPKIDEGEWSPNWRSWEFCDVFSSFPASHHPKRGVKLCLFHRTNSSSLLRGSFIHSFSTVFLATRKSPLFRGDQRADTVPR